LPGRQNTPPGLHGNSIQNCYALIHLYFKWYSICTRAAKHPIWHLCSVLLHLCITCVFCSISIYARAAKHPTWATWKFSILCTYTLIFYTVFYLYQGSKTPHLGYMESWCYGRSTKRNLFRCLSSLQWLNCCLEKDAIDCVMSLFLLISVEFWTI
jgi:hypothetical protein